MRRRWWWYESATYLVGGVAAFRGRGARLRRLPAARARRRDAEIELAERKFDEQEQHRQAAARAAFDLEQRHAREAYAIESEYLAELAEIKRVELASRVAPAPSRTAPSP